MPRKTKHRAMYCCGVRKRCDEQLVSFEVSCLDRAYFTVTIGIQ